jgi:cell cycle sensor histidine kinase DivJ
MLGPVAERYGVALSVAMTGPGDAAPVVRADPVALRQALLNFVDNGLKFTPAGGRVQLSARRDGAGGVVLEVADSGVGMSAGRLAALEEPLAEGGAAPVNGATGLGLGLSLSRGLLALMGFTSRIESAVDAGTTVWVEIPAKALVAAAAPSSATAPS